MNTITLGDGYKTIEIDINYSEISSRAKRDSAIKARTLSTNAEGFEVLTLNADDAGWIKDKTLEAVKMVYLLLSPYGSQFATNNLVNTEEGVKYEIKLSSSFDDNQASGIEMILTKILSKQVLIEWYQETIRLDIVKVLVDEVNLLKEELKSTLYKWRVIRESATEKIVITEGTLSNTLALNIPYTELTNQITDDLNASLKAQCKSTEEYERLKVTTYDEARIKTLIKRGTNAIIENTDTYCISSSLETGVGLSYEISKSFRLINATSIEERVRMAVIFLSCSAWFEEIGNNQIGADYLQRHEKSLGELSEILYKWRVERTKVAITTTLDETQADVNTLAYSSTFADMTAEVAGNINASLKTRCKSTEEFDKVKITENEHLFIKSQIIKAVNTIIEQTESYCTGYEVVNNIGLTFTLNKTFKTVNKSNIEERIKGIIIAQCGTAWFEEVGDKALQDSYNEKQNVSLTELKSTLYKWRVIRTETIEPIILLVPGEEENKIIIGIPYDVLITNATEQINSKLKVLCQTDDELKRLKVTSTEQTDFLNKIKNEILLISEKTQAYKYAVYPKTTGEILLAKADELSGTEHVASNNESQYAGLILNMPITFDPTLSMNVANEIENAIISTLTYLYLNEVNIDSQIALKERDQHHYNIMAILHRRQERIRRFANFLS